MQAGFNFPALSNKWKGVKGMSLAKGIKTMKDTQKKIQASMKASGGRYIGIGDTESFLFRFMLNEDSIINGYFHRVPMEQSDRKWTQDTLCLGDDCPYCSSDDANISKKSYKFLTWVWVYYKLHTNPDDEGKWEPVERDEGTFYQEKIDKAMILKQGYYFSRLLTAIYAKYHSLIDRDYDCTRTGTGLDTSYSLFPEDKKVMPKKVKAAIKELDSIESIIDGDKSDSKPKPKPKSKKKAIAEEEEVEEEEVEEDEEEEFEEEPF